MKSRVLPVTCGGLWSGAEIRQFRRAAVLGLVVFLHLAILLAVLVPPDGTRVQGVDGGSVLRFSLVSQRGKPPLPTVAALDPSVPDPSVMEPPIQPDEALLDPVPEGASAADSGTPCHGPSDIELPFAALPFPALNATPSESRTVALSLWVEADGRVNPEGIMVVESSGIAEVDTAAVLFVREHRMLAGTCDGIPTRMQHDYRVTFQ